MTRVAWFNGFSGISGDMALGALIDAGAAVDEVREMLCRLPVDGWTLDAGPTLRCGLAGTKAKVEAMEGTVHRTAADIGSMIAAAGLPERVAARSLAVFNALAEVEGLLHARPPSEVHFHEVGAIDSIVDVVGTCAALEVLGIDEVRSGSVATGQGMVESAHGLIPVPAPATIALLVGAPTHGTDVPFELTTPTGAALLAALVVDWGPMPAMVVEATGYGAGDRDLEGRPNLLQVVLGTSVEAAPGTPGSGQALVQLEVNVDDATGETLAHAIAECLAAGANDAWITPMVMKKGRPAHTVSALCDPATVGVVAGVLTAETGSLGVRAHSVERWAVPRTMHVVEVDGHPVAVKVSAGRAKAEHDDAARVARATARPLREVVALAEEAWRNGAGRAGSPGSTPTPSGGKPT
jgi:hypothetical protein